MINRENRQRLSHEQVRKYIDGQPDERIAKFRQDDDTYQLFFEILDELRSGERVSQEKPDFDMQKLIRRTEDALIRMASGDFSQTDAGYLLNAIYHSPLFYERLILKLEQIAPAIAGKELPEMSEIAIPDDDEILRKLTVLKDKKTERFNLKDKLNKLLDFIILPQKPIPRLAYVLTIIFIVVGGYWGFNYYKTSFQLSRAENLLQQNYRVYFADQTRPSGNYESTGISELMGDQDEPYLAEARRLTEDVINYDADNREARQLKGQIFLLQKKYNAADSVYRQLLAEGYSSAALLNDLGVLHFRQDKFDTAAGYFRRAINLKPDDGEPYYNLALTFIKSGSPEQARPILNQYLEIETNPGWRNAALNLLQGLKHSKN